MAITITKRGKKKEMTYVGTCYKCKTEVAAKKGDLDHHHMEPSGDPREHSYDTVLCPVCGASIYMAEAV